MQYYLRLICNLTIQIFLKNYVSNFIKHYIFFLYKKKHSIIVNI